MAQTTRKIGLSLGADICCPICFEQIMRRLDRGEAQLGVLRGGRVDEAHRRLAEVEEDRLHDREAWHREESALDLEEVLTHQQGEHDEHGVDFRGVADDLRVQIVRLDQVDAVTLQHSKPALVLAYERYRDAERDAEIVGRNRTAARNPLAIAADTELELLRAD